ncbi:hypothetical protein C6P45_000454 [Maudiozyma exigua]|uniref:Ubiquitin carboxyl-terminal hydrolase n=1 Tax=Maudiozyma exigua TaxID=34358 RepID=A0A9P6W6V3_MAUEX|nr:hypothetical protein C6P45_000454 [Kazachstania exigua]
MSLKTSNIISNLFGLSDNSQRKIYYGLGLSVSLYILFPSLHSIFQKLLSQGEFKNSDGRNDRKTTGFVNSANDCYANSSIQALVSLDHLTEYLNKVLKDVCTKDDTLGQLKRDFPMHFMLADILQKLQKPISESETISIKTVKQTLEYIFKVKISREQNDAQEFTNAVLESLKQEYEVFSKTSESRLSFPFQGKIGTQLVCLNCHGTSEMKEQEFLIYQTVAPQKYSTTLKSLLSEDQTDIVSDYKCLRCLTRTILANEKATTNNQQSVHLDYLTKNYESLLINSDIPEEVMNYIKMYNKNGCVPYTKGSQVIKRSVVVNSPNELIIHISRSMFNGSSTTRNGCRVSFDETIELPEQQIQDNKCVSIKKISYRLRSVVKHTGTHYQGHYQCFRHKPNLVRDKETAKIVNLSPTVMLPPDQVGMPLTKIDKKKYKRIKSVVTKNFWKISDSSVEETNVNSVMNETKYVYMLYYERV